MKKTIKTINRFSFLNKLDPFGKMPRLRLNVSARGLRQIVAPVIIFSLIMAGGLFFAFEQAYADHLSEQISRLGERQEQALTKANERKEALTVRHERTLSNIDDRIAKENEHLEKRLGNIDFQLQKAEDNLNRQLERIEQQIANRTSKSQQNIQRFENENDKIKSEKKIAKEHQNMEKATANFEKQKQRHIDNLAKKVANLENKKEKEVSRTESKVAKLIERKNKEIEKFEEQMRQLDQREADIKAEFEEKIKEIEERQEREHAEETSTPTPTITSTPSPSNAKVVGFGDSLVKGIGSSPGNDFLSVLSRNVSVPIINKGAIGNTTADALARVNNDVIAHNPDIVIVLVGGNDFLDRILNDTASSDLPFSLEEVASIKATQESLGEFNAGTPISLEETTDNIIEIVEKSQESGAEVILLGVGGGRLINQRLVADYNRIVSETGVTLIPNILDGIIGNPRNTSDIVHPNDRGYAIIASRVQSALENALENITPSPTPSTCSPNISRDVSGDITSNGLSDGTSKAFLRNTSKNCDYLVSFASYKMFIRENRSGWLENQEIYDSQTLTLNHNSTANFQIDVPDCRYQLDLIEGNPINPPNYNSPGHKLFDFAFVNESICLKTTPTHSPTPSPSRTPSPTPSVLWSAGMETGNLSEWWRPCYSEGSCGDEDGGEFNSALGNSGASRDFAHSGNLSAKLSITTPPKSSTKLTRKADYQNEGSELYYSSWYYLPESNEPLVYWNIMEFESIASSTGLVHPFFMGTVRNRVNGNMYLSLYDWQNQTNHDQTIKDIPVGEWFHLEAFYQCSGDDDGRITIWQNNTKLFDMDNIQTSFPDSGCRWSAESHSSGLNPSSAVIYIDDAKISTTRAGTATTSTVYEKKSSKTFAFWNWRWSQMYPF